MTRPELSQYSGEGEGKGRAYKHPFRLNEQKKPVTSPSVTTILKLEAKDALIQWAADLTLKWAIENWQTLGRNAPEDALRKGKYRWRDVRDERAFVGTGVHDTIEAEHTGAWEYPELDEEQLLIMAEWRAFNEEYDVEPILTECTVWNLSYDYAGTFDGLWRITNRETGESYVTLIDIKTSKNTWDAHRMQLSALKHAEVLMEKQADGTWVERDMPSFDKLMLLHLRAPEFNDIGQKVKEGKHELIEVEDSELWFDEFIGYRHVWEAQAKRKAHEKKKEIASYGGFA